MRDWDVMWALNTRGRARVIQGSAPWGLGQRYSNTARDAPPVAVSRVGCCELDLVANSGRGPCLPPIKERWVGQPQWCQRTQKSTAGPAPRRIGNGAASVTISLARMEWSRSNHNGQLGGGRDGESYQWLAFVPTRKAPPKQSLNGAP